MTVYIIYVYLVPCTGHLQYAHSHQEPSGVAVIEFMVTDHRKNKLPDQRLQITVDGEHKLLWFDHTEIVNFKNITPNRLLSLSYISFFFQKCISVSAIVAL